MGTFCLIEKAPLGFAARSESDTPLSFPQIDRSRHRDIPATTPALADLGAP
jgi:hypothetical protein